MRVGFIGLGAMGLPMARNLRAAGFDVVVHNRSRGKVNDFVAAGGEAASTPAQVAASVDVVCACLPIPPVCEEVFLGSNGVIEGASAGQLWIDFSTNGPDTSQRVSDAAAARGCGYLDAPISGGVWGAEAGTLAIMVGGEAADFERAGPVFDAVGANIRHFGPSGGGSVVKLCNNLIGAAVNAVISEAYVAAVKYGIDPAAMYETLQSATASSPGHERMVKESVLARDFDPKFALDLHAKDQQLAADLGKLTGVRMLVTSAVNEVYKEAQARGYGGQNTSAVIRPLEDLHDVTVAPAS
jgi:3-hydroxyisobutyrate dehydrogenase-like beta-hydroxyacid dehydrogenase